ncbi:hypothetical protein Tco_1229748 [Tanacetum coccineum]
MLIFLMSTYEVHAARMQSPYREQSEDANLKLLRSLPSAWNNIALIMRNKSDLDILSMDDLYNNLKVSTNEIVNTAHNVSATSSKDQALVCNEYSLKDKNEAKTDKTEHENRKSVKSQKVKVKVEAKDVCIDQPAPKLIGRDSRIEWWKAMEGARVMTRGFEDLVAKLGDKVVMEVLVRCWSDGDVVVRSW